MNHARRTQSEAFSLVEILVVIAIVGIGTGILLPFVTGAPEAAKKRKLEQDVELVNNAIDSYLASGGAPEDLTEGNVLNALKSRVYGGMPAEMLGPQGPFLDASVVTNATDFSWSALYTTSPRPRFYVAENRGGVVFGTGPATAVGGAAERPNEARPSWLWTYGEATKAAVAESFTPVAVDVASVSTNVPIVGVTLGPPVVAPGSLTANLWGYPLQVTMTNTNTARSSRIYYKVGSGNFSLYDDGSTLSVGPGSSLLAVCVSLDPSRYYNSVVASNFYGVIPLELAVKVSAPGSVTYAQAGGVMQGANQLQPVSATISLEGTTAGGATDNLLVKEGETDRYIPPQYLQDANFAVRYTTDGSDPSTGGTFGPSFNGFFSSVSVPLGLAVWGTNNSVTIRAAAISKKPEWFASSPVSQASSAVAYTELPVVILPSNPVGLPSKLIISNIGLVPAGVRIFYRLNGVAPLTAVQGGIPANNPPSPPVPDSDIPNASFVAVAQATGPSGLEQWFSSGLATRNYNIVTVLNPDFVGANISGGDVNGEFRGSIFVSAPAALGIFNAGGRITGGNLYVPGGPAIEIPGSGNSTKTVVARGQSYVEQGQIPRDLVGGKEFTADGQLADPQLDTRQVVDLNGALTPTNYTVKLTKSAYIEGKIYRRADPPPAPAVPTVPTDLVVRTNTLSGVFQTNIPAGVYSNRITMNNTNSVLRLGAAGPLVSQYVFVGNTWNKGRVEILGPVEIYFRDGFDNKGVIFGSSNNVAAFTAAPLVINVMTNAVDITGGGAVYASMWAANSAVTIGNASFFYGSIYARTLTVSPGGTVNVD